MVAITVSESASKTGPEKNLSFRWRYIILPAAILLISVILTASFYGRLPGEVAYHFEDGVPDQWLSRGAIIAWMIIPQLFLVFVGITISGVGTVLSTRFQLSESAQLRKVLAIMGNMVALPQIILAFAMLDIFLYNAYRVHLIPLWAFALIVMVAGGTMLGVFFVQALRQSQPKSLQE